MKKFIAIALALASTGSFAADKVLTKSVKPYRIVVAKDGSALAQFSVLSSDFTDQKMHLAAKKLESIYWETTYYPDNFNEVVEICYSQPGRIESDVCREIEPASSGTITEFNSYKFDKHSRIVIRHSVAGGKNYGAAAGEDKVVITFSY